MSNPAAPFEASVLALGFRTQAIDASGNYVYIVGYNGALDLYDIDVSNAAAPSVAGAVGTTEVNWRDVEVQGTYAYATGDGDLFIFDVINPAVPTGVTSFDPGNALGLTVSGDYVYVAAGGNTFTIVDVSNPAAPFQAGIAGMAGVAWDVALSGRYAYVANGEYGVRVFDVWDPTAPVEVGHFDTGGDARRIAVRDDYVYVGDYYDGVWILHWNPVTGIDDSPPSLNFAMHECVPNPFNPSTIVSYDLPEPTQVTLRIYDVGGRLIRVLRDGVHEGPGGHEVRWDGTDDAGQSVASGVYFCKLQAGRDAATKRMVFIK